MTVLSDAITALQSTMTTSSASIVAAAHHLGARGAGNPCVSDTNGRALAGEQLVAAPLAALAAAIAAAAAAAAP